jgi:hypothetical protein
LRHLRFRVDWLQRTFSFCSHAVKHAKAKISAALDHPSRVGQLLSGKGRQLTPEEARRFAVVVHHAHFPCGSAFTAVSTQVVSRYSLALRDDERMFDSTIAQSSFSVT